MFDRRAARRMVARMRRDEVTDRPDLLGVYRCDQSTRLWHVGHVNRATQGANWNDPRLRFL